MTRADIAAWVPQVLENNILLNAKEYFDFWNAKYITFLNRPDMVGTRVITVPTSSNTVAFQTKAEGDAMATGDFTTSSFDITPTVDAVKVVMTREMITDSAFDINSYVQGVLAESYADSLDTKIYDAIQTTTETVIDGSAGLISLAFINQAKAAFGKTKRGELTLFISPDQEATVRTLVDGNGNTVFNVSTGEFREGVIGTIYGVNIEVSEKVVADAGVYTNYMVQDKSVLFALTYSLELDSEWDKDKLVYTVYANYISGVALDPSKKVVPITFAETV